MQTQNLVLSIHLWSLPIVPKWTTFLLYCTFYILQGKQHDWVTTERIPQCDSAALLLSSAVNIKEGKSRPYDNLSLDALGQKGTTKCVHACFSNIQYRVRELVLLEVEWLLFSRQSLAGKILPGTTIPFQDCHLFNNTHRTDAHWDHSPLP